MAMKVGLLHPGAMGVTVGQTLMASGHSVLWVPAGRSDATRRRAEEGAFEACGDLAELAARAAVVVSVCPPEQAAAQARAVAESGFGGLYLDANAIAPASALALGAAFGERFVDGGVIGPPAREPGTTRLYLSGPRAAELAALFSAGPLQAMDLAAPAGDASALKMCYAAYSKGAAALLLNVRALAQQQGVEQTLLAEWALSQPGLAERCELTARAVAPKAWRFTAEMAEIAATFEAAGLSGAFHDGARAVYERLVPFKTASTSELTEVLAALRGPE